MAQVELPVLPPRVDLIDADELSVPGIPDHTKTEQRKRVSRVNREERQVRFFSRRFENVSSLVKEAARPRVPLQDDVVSFSLGEEIPHLQSCRPGSKNTVIIAAGAIVVVVVEVVFKGAFNTANQDEED